MRRAAAADPPSGSAAGTSGEATSIAGAAARGATPARGTAAATPPVTVAEATACSPRRRIEAEVPLPRNGARPAEQGGASQSRPGRPSATGPTAPTGDAAERSEAVQRIVADLQHRLGEPARG